jgi:hypothetical protein
MLLLHARNGHTPLNCSEIPDELDAGLGGQPRPLGQDNGPCRGHSVERDEKPKRVEARDLASTWPCLSSPCQDFGCVSCVRLVCLRCFFCVLCVWLSVCLFLCLCLCQYSPCEGRGSIVNPQQTWSYREPNLRMGGVGPKLSPWALTLKPCPIHSVEICPKS